MAVLLHSISRACCYGCMGHMHVWLLVLGINAIECSHGNVQTLRDMCSYTFLTNRKCVYHQPWCSNATQSGSRYLHSAGSGKLLRGISGGSVKFIASNSSYVRGVTVTTKSPTFVPAFRTLATTDPVPSSSLKSTWVKPSVSCCPVEVDIRSEWVQVCAVWGYICLTVIQCNLCC